MNYNRTVMNESPNGNLKRLVTKTVSIPIWMENYLKDKAHRDNVTVSDIIRGLVQEIYDADQAEKSVSKNP